MLVEPFRECQRVDDKPVDGGVSLMKRRRHRAGRKAVTVFESLGGTCMSPSCIFSFGR